MKWRKTLTLTEGTFLLFQPYERRNLRVVGGLYEKALL